MLILFEHFDDKATPVNMDQRSLNNAADMIADDWHIEIIYFGY